MLLTRGESCRFVLSPAFHRFGQPADREGQGNAQVPYFSHIDPGIIQTLTASRTLKGNPGKSNPEGWGEAKLVKDYIQCYVFVLFLVRTASSQYGSPSRIFLTCTHSNSGL